MKEEKLFRILLRNDRKIHSGELEKGKGFPSTNEKVRAYSDSWFLDSFSLSFGRLQFSTKSWLFPTEHASKFDVCSSSEN